jgi:hypothetical protein|tara:strand:+ start:756 stop:890 length:135 start_codon:yes stop_codon:yes gene_type:complete
MLSQKKQIDNKITYRNTIEAIDVVVWLSFVIGSYNPLEAERQSN